MSNERTTNYTDVLRDDEWDDLVRQYAEVEAAPDPEPVPSGTYKVHVVHGKLFRSPEKGTRGYRLTFEVVEGEHRGRRIWDTTWITGPALSTAKRKLGALGFRGLEQVHDPLPENLFCTVQVVVRREDDGSLWNRVLTISDVVRQPNYSRTVDEDFKEETGRVRHTERGA